MTVTIMNHYNYYMHCIDNEHDDEIIIKIMSKSTYNNCNNWIIITIKLYDH